ncbi:MAG TPA: WhiB family transcriptional regulator [Acidimicrobiales bacterium]|nr:WhiB family transcriptional regulator [Acidimicrobiales bacterium]
MTLTRTMDVLAERPSDSDWRREAACRLMPADLFFPVGAAAGALEEIEAAKRVCGGCPVSVECLEFALSTRQEFGVWGGLDEEERRLIVKGRRALR